MDGPGSQKTDDAVLDIKTFQRMFTFKWSVLNKSESIEVPVTFFSLIPKKGAVGLKDVVLTRTTFPEQFLPRIARVAPKATIQKPSAVPGPFKDAKHLFK